MTKMKTPRQRIEVAKRRRHGFSKTNTYKIWSLMRQRCSNKNGKNYKNYGGRGIKVSDRWQKFVNFLEDMGERPGKEYTLDRINNDGDYCKENCKWSTWKEQNRNKRSNVLRNGETLSEADNRLGSKKGLVYRRLQRGWSEERAYNTPPRYNGKGNKNRFNK